MNLIYFKSDIGNFGDDLNPWLWSKLLGDFDNYPSDIDFVGIGSILDKRILVNPSQKKIVFGSGIRDYNFSFSKDDNIEFKFVRGPYSSKATKNSKFITDAAYCINLLNDNEIIQKKYKLSYIPYFRNYYNFNWVLFEKFLGIHVINPTDEVTKVIDEIKKSEHILTSSMHGAIIADIYRIPWMRVNFTVMGRETPQISELKWKDWTESIALNNVPTHDFNFDLNKKGSFISDLKKLTKFYKVFKMNDFVTSSDDILSEVTEKLNIEINLFKKNYTK